MISVWVFSLLPHFLYYGRPSPNKNYFNRSFGSRTKPVLVLVFGLLRYPTTFHISLWYSIFFLPRYPLFTIFLFFFLGTLHPKTHDLQTIVSIVTPRHIITFPQTVLLTLQTSYNSMVNIFVIWTSFRLTSFPLTCTQTTTSGLLSQILWLSPNIDTLVSLLYSSKCDTGRRRTESR